MIESKPQTNRITALISPDRMKKQLKAVFILLVMLSYGPGFALAQQPADNVWMPVQRVPDYTDQTQPPIMITDENRTVHAFTSQWVNENNNGKLAILYRQWSVAGGWTTPVDVLLSPLSQARMHGAFLDPYGTVHVVFFGGDDVAANIYYSSAPLANAGKANAWTSPQPIAGQAITPDFAALAGDDKGNLVVIYNGKMERIGLYAVFSTDYGKSWSETIPVSLDYTGEQMPAWVHLSTGAHGYVYAVWNMVNAKGHNISGKFARFDLKTHQWSEATDFAQSIGAESGMGIMNAAVLEYKNQVLIRYSNGIPPEGVPPAEWIQTSTDQGQTWSAPLRVFPDHVGRNGVASFVVDGNQDLHLLFTQRRPFTINGVYTAIGGAWYSRWLPDGRWSEPVLIADNAQYPDITFDAYDVRAVIVQGNVLLATWRSDPGGENNGVWYTYTQLNAPELPVKALPMPAPTATRTPHPTTETQTGTPPTSTPRPFVSAEDKAGPAQTGNTVVPVIVGAASALLVIGLTVIIRFYSSRFNR